MLSNDDADILSLETVQKYDNLTPFLSDPALASLGQLVKSGFEIDLRSLDDVKWKETIEEGMKIAKQVIETKDTPWPNASNIKYPLITVACQDFSARLRGMILPPGNVVKAKVWGVDSDNAILKRGNYVSETMSYQLTQESPDWVDGVDMLLPAVCLIGTCFKKTYYSEIHKRNCSDYCAPDTVIVNYGTKSLEAARRITHIVEKSWNEVLTGQLMGFYNENINIDDVRPVSASPDDEDFMLTFHEQHLWLDLDDDGYKEPYICIVHLDSGKVLSLQHRIEDIIRNDKGQVTKIDPVHYFTDYHFMRSTDGGFYSLGLIHILLSTNASINSAMNQLMDAATAHNTQGGFYPTGLRIPNGELTISMNRWNPVDMPLGQHSLAQSIVPFPTKEPSAVLYSLVQLLIKVGQELTGATDINKGRQPAQNVSTGTVGMLEEQASTLFTSVAERILRAQGKDYQKWYRLNNKHLTNKQYRRIINDPEANVKVDFEIGSCDVYPVADPKMASMTQRLAKIQTLMQLPTVDPRERDRFVIDTMQLDPSIVEKLLPPMPENQPPPADVVKAMAQAELYKTQSQILIVEQQREHQKLMMEMEKLRQEMKESESRILESGGRTVKMQHDIIHNQEKNKITATKMMSEQSLKASNAEHSRAIDSLQKQLEASELALKDKKIMSDTTVSLAKVTLDKDKHDKEIEIKSKESSQQEKGDK